MGQFKQDDQYYKDMGIFLEKKAKELNSSYGKYITCLDNILEEAIIEGDMHNQLLFFRNKAVGIKGKIDDIGVTSRGLCRNFSNEVVANDTFDLTQQGD